MEDVTDRALTRYQGSSHVNSSVSANTASLHVSSHTPIRQVSARGRQTSWRSRLTVIRSLMKSIARRLGPKSDVRALRLDPLSPEFRKLKSSFRNVLVTFKHMKSRCVLMLSVYSSLTNDRQYHGTQYSFEIPRYHVRQQRNAPVISVGLCKTPPIITLARRINDGNVK